MALGSTNISTAAVNTELLSPYTTPRIIRQLCTHANAGNIASLYGPGTLAVDASKNVYWVAPSSNYKLGDFRLYNRTASMPSFPNSTINWGPTGSSVNATITTLPEQLNVLFVNSGATYIHYRAYLTTANRTAETSPWDTQISAWNSQSLTPPTGHTRSQTSKPQSPHIQTFNNFVTTGLTTPNDYVYFDAFFSPAGGTRYVNFGDAVANGYATYTFHQLQNPTIYASGIAPTPWPTGYTYTGIYPVVWNTSTPCGTGTIAGGSIGSSTITFYVGMHGQRSGTKSISVTSMTIRITYDGATKDVNLGSVSSSTKDYVSTTLPGGKTWQYDKNAIITCTAATFAAYPSEYSC